jgi:hypothetical protein
VLTTLQKYVYANGFPTSKDPKSNSNERRQKIVESRPSIVFAQVGDNFGVHDEEINPSDDEDEDMRIEKDEEAIDEQNSEPVLQDVAFDAKSMSDSGDEEERKDEVGQLPMIGLTSRDDVPINNVD